MTRKRWAQLRFSVVGQLLAAPPAKGELRAAIASLAARQWCHPGTGEPVRFGFSRLSVVIISLCGSASIPSASCAASDVLMPTANRP